MYRSDPERWQKTVFIACSFDFLVPKKGKQIGKGRSYCKASRCVIFFFFLLQQEKFHCSDVLGIPKDSCVLAQASSEVDRHCDSGLSCQSDSTF